MRAGKSFRVKGDLREVKEAKEGATEEGMREEMAQKGERKRKRKYRGEKGEVRVELGEAR